VDHDTRYDDLEIVPDEELDDVIGGKAPAINVQHILMKGQCRCGQH
jgi:hypothetical protein